jgi:polar amino acid transport system substrate-binding protein
MIALLQATRERVMVLNRETQRRGAGLRGRQAIFALAFTLGLSVSAQAEPPPTVEPGKLTVAFTGDMPMTSWKDGKLIGTDGGLLAAFAERLGLEIVPAQMEWSATIQSVNQRKVDVMLGAMNWSKERADILAITDPIYYLSAMLVQKEENNFQSTEDMAGHTVGTVNGYAVVPELKNVEGITELKLYDTADAVLRDVVAGRLDMAILDPPSIQLAIKEHPEWGIKQMVIKADTAKYPVMGGRLHMVLGVSKENPELLDALNKEIRTAWETCENVKNFALYGMNQATWFDPPTENIRAGADRPADWTLPVLGPDCAKELAQ